MERCPVAVDLIGAGPGPCPALEYSDGRFWCGVVLNPRKYVNGVDGADRLTDAQLQVAIASVMNFGYGCDSEIVGLDGTDVPYIDT